MSTVIVTQPNVAVDPACSDFETQVQCQLAILQMFEDARRLASKKVCSAESRRRAVTMFNAAALLNTMLGAGDDVIFAAHKVRCTSQ